MRGLKFGLRASFGLIVAAVGLSTAAPVCAATLIANIGGPYTFTPDSQSITLYGTGSSGPINSYMWYRGVGADGPLIQLATTAAPQFTDSTIASGLPVGFVYSYGLRVADGSGTSDLVRTTATVVSVAGAVPEPATWALMLLGFGGIGVAMRRRRRFAALQVA